METVNSKMEWIIAILIGMFFVQLWTTTLPWPRPVYEYEIIFIQDTDTEKLQSKGSQGWEVISARRTNSNASIYSPQGYEYIMKRQILFNR